MFLPSIQFVVTINPREAAYYICLCAELFLLLILIVTCGLLVILYMTFPFVWIHFVIYVTCLSSLCHFVCSLQPCGHLLGKG